MDLRCSYRMALWESVTVALKETKPFSQASLSSNKRFRNHDKGQGIVGEIAGHARSTVHTRLNEEQKTMDISLLYI